MSTVVNRRLFLQTLGAAASIQTAVAPSAIAASDSYPDRNALEAAHKAKGIISPVKTYRMMEWECHTPPAGTSISKSRTR